MLVHSARMGKKREWGSSMTHVSKCVIFLFTLLVLSCRFGVLYVGKCLKTTLMSFRVAYDSNVRHI